MSVDEFLEIILTLPEVSENESFSDMTAFKVRGKGFCYLNEAEQVVSLKALREEQAALIAEDPGTFSPSWAGGRFAWVNVELGNVERAEVAELVTEAWRLTAPKSLARTLRGPAGATAP